MPSVTAVGVDGGSNSPGGAADGEVELDIEVAGAVAPKAAQVVYFAPNTDQGFIDAISDAIHATPTPIVVSISWGGPEDSWTAQSRTAMDEAIADGATLGVTVTVAAGDNGSSDSSTDVPQSVRLPRVQSARAGLRRHHGRRERVDVRDHVRGRMERDRERRRAGRRRRDRRVPPPSWQATAGVPAAAAGDVVLARDRTRRPRGRGVPDVAGNADPETGYQVVVDGQSQSIGGTSAVAPLWAALIARLAQGTGKRFGLLQPLVYAGITPGTDVAGFHDITTGSNGAYSAGPGWDACSGLGSPDGTELLSRLS